MKRTLIITLVLMGMYTPYHTYMAGRSSMYQEVISAAGGVPGAILQVLLPNNEPIYHPAGICFTCHQ